MSNQRGRFLVLYHWALILVCAMEMAMSFRALKGQATNVHLITQAFEMKSLESDHLKFLHGNYNEKNFVQLFPDFLALLKINVTCAQNSKSRRNIFKPSSSSLLFQSVIREDRTKDSGLLTNSQICSCCCLMHSYQRKYSVRMTSKCQICNADTRHR